MVIYKDTVVQIEIKGIHVSKMGGRILGGFHKDNGDIPVARFNVVTGKIEDVENRRGNAYAHRNAKRFRSMRRS